MRNKQQGEPSARLLLCLQTYCFGEVIMYDGNSYFLENTVFVTRQQFASLPLWKNKIDTWYTVLTFFVALPVSKL